MSNPIPHETVDGVLVVRFGEEELFDRLVEPCREIFNEAFSSACYDVVLDFTSAVSIDSFFLAMLVLLYKEVRGSSGEVKIVGLGERLTEIFDRVHFRKLFDEYDTVEDAVEAFRSNRD